MAIGYFAGGLQMEQALYESPQPFNTYSKFSLEQ